MRRSSLERERCELIVKIIKLDMFIKDAEKFDKLTVIERRLLQKQFKHMVKYDRVLGKRLALLKDLKELIE